MNKTKLKNGLNIISQYNDVDIVSISYLINCGSYDEELDERGIAHFTEHMLFKGTTNRSSKQISEDIEGIGGILNAETSFQYTKYYCSVPADYWKIGVDVLSDLVWNNLIPEGEFERERNVILEELKMYDDAPSSKVYDLLFTHLHPSYTNRQLAGGTIETVSKITRQQMLNFIDKFYNPKNITIVAAGKIDHEELVQFVEKLMSSIEFKDTLTNVGEEFIADSLDREDLIEHKEIAQAHVCWGMFGPEPQERDYITGKVIATLLGGNSSSRLYQSIREKQGLAYNIYMYSMMTKDLSLLIGGVSLEENNIDKVKNEIFNEFDNLKNELVDIEELNRVKSFIKGISKINLETTIEKNNFICDNVIYDTEHDIEFYYQAIDSITPLDIKNFSNKYFRDDNICFVQLLPKN